MSETAQQWITLGGAVLGFSALAALLYASAQEKRRVSSRARTRMGSR